MAWPTTRHPLPVTCYPPPATRHPSPVTRHPRKSPAAADLAAEHLFFSPIDESQNVKLYWNVDAAKKDIFFTVEAKTTGWVGFGFSSGQK